MLMRCDPYAPQPALIRRAYCCPFAARQAAQKTCTGLACSKTSPAQGKMGTFARALCFPLIVVLWL